MSESYRESIISYIRESLSLKFRDILHLKTAQSIFSRFLQNILISLEIFCCSKKLVIKLKGATY